MKRFFLDYILKQRKPLWCMKVFYTVDFGEQCGWSFNGGITKKTKSGIKLFRGRYRYKLYIFSIFLCKIGVLFGRKLIG